MKVFRGETKSQIKNMNKRLQSTELTQDCEWRVRMTKESEGGQQAWGDDTSGLRAVAGSGRREPTPHSIRQATLVTPAKVWKQSKCPVDG